jgi:hypothetical protein
VLVELSAPVEHHAETQATRPWRDWRFWNREIPHGHIYRAIVAAVTTRPISGAVALPGASCKNASRVPSTSSSAASCITSPVHQLHLPSSTAYSSGWPNLRATALWNTKRSGPLCFHTISHLYHGSVPSREASNNIRLWTLTAMR